MTMSVDGYPAPRTGALSRRRNQNFYPAVQVVTKRDILEESPPRSRSSLRVINQSCIKLTGENEAVVPMFFKGPQPIPLSIGVRVTEGRTSRHRSGNEISEWQRFYSCRGLNPAAWHWEADQYLYEVRNSGWLPFQFLVVGPLWLFPSIQSKKKKKKKEQRLYEKLLWSLACTRCALFNCLPPQSWSLARCLSPSNKARIANKTVRYNHTLAYLHKYGGLPSKQSPDTDWLQSSSDTLAVNGTVGLNQS